VADDGLTSIWFLLLIWIAISVLAYSPPPVPKKKEEVLSSEEGIDDSFLTNLMWLSQND